MTRPRMASNPAYAISWRSNARQAAPIDRAAQSLIRAGSTRITPMVGLRPGERRVGSGREARSSSVGLVEVAALQQVEIAVLVLDAEVELEEVLDDLRPGVAFRPRVVGEG